MIPEDLEAHIRPIDAFVVHSKKETYYAILEVLSTTPLPTAVGYHRDYGWFVLSNDYDQQTPSLLWSERNPDR